MLLDGDRMQCGKSRVINFKTVECNFEDMLREVRTAHMHQAVY